MDAPQRLRAACEVERSRLRASIPNDTEGAIISLLGHRDRLPYVVAMRAEPDVLTGRRLIDAGGNLALALALEVHGTEPVPRYSSLNSTDWSGRFRSACHQLALAELVAMQCEAGALRLIGSGDGQFDAWPASPRRIASIGERADWDWWAVASEHQVRESQLASEPASGDCDDAGTLRESARNHVARMAYQLCYPDDSELCGLWLHECRAVLAVLIQRLLRSDVRDEQPAFESRRELVRDVANELGDEPDQIAGIVSALSLDIGGAGYHGAVPGVAAAPIVRVGEDRVILSRYGLLSHPLLFMTRELRRRNAQAYHNVAHLRERTFRDDLISLFGDKRFVCSENQLKLRRKAGTLRTDIDFAVFDRKSGALGVFELKAQDPFARSAEELRRQRDNVLDANRQVAATLDWVNRHGGDEILSRIDPGIARRFRVRKVFAFVLGRYLVHFHDGPAPSPRAAWGTWPEVLRVADQGRRFAAGQSPIATLFARLSSDDISRNARIDAPVRLIEVGTTRIGVHPSYTALQRTASENV